ncbi:betaine--homocysteine S-methyltransferase 1-like isoform X2 [Anneissia japonica]|uniref:betaine--homocysteine S-methyltransferase 1-like isoform X2 n=1 Tax=Anneissia japonica TaxID=1529436 RepID=UPI0014259731|nr:betaine--homocysteine S-methyltransferase 1-like isoform X2 [Anneissia japonica]
MKMSEGVCQEPKKGLLELLAERPVIGDGSYAITLEKRGYVTAGSWTPEAVIKYPEAVKQLHKDFIRAGSDVIQAYSFYGTDDKLSYTTKMGKKIVYTSDDVNEAACNIAFEAAGNSILVCGGLSPTPAYTEGKGKEFVQAEFRKQIDIYKRRNVDFLLAEFFAHIEEAEWALEVMKEMTVPLACTLRIGPVGDSAGVSVEECTLRMAKAGADVIGTNCMYDPTIALKTMKMMKETVDKNGLNVFLMTQPVGYHTQEIEEDKRGYFALPEFPFAMETRLLNRIDAHKFAREAFDLGVRYLGGCCGFEPYHIRALAEELAEERGFRPPGSDMHEGFDALKLSISSDQWKR